MYNIAKLSDMSRTFVTKLQAGCTANLAAAKAVANYLALPTGPVSNPEEHYREVHYGSARQLVSELNEVAIINARDVLEMVQSFWKARYGVVYPERVQPLNLEDTCYAFMGYGMYLPAATRAEIEKGGNVLIRQLNGFTAVVADLTKVAETPVEETSTAYASEQLGLAQESFSGWLGGFFASMPVLSTAIGGTTRSLLVNRRKEVLKIADEIKKLRDSGAKAALDENRIKDGEYKSAVKVEALDIIEGAIIGTIPFIGPFYNGNQASKLQDEQRKLTAKLEELNELIKAHGITKKDIQSSKE